MLNVARKICCHKLTLHVSWMLAVRQHGLNATHVKIEMGKYGWDAMDLWASIGLGFLGAPGREHVQVFAA